MNRIKHCNYISIDALVMGLDKPTLASLVKLPQSPQSPQSSQSLQSSTQTDPFEALGIALENRTISNVDLSLNNTGPHDQMGHYRPPYQSQSVHHLDTNTPLNIGDSADESSRNSVHFKSKNLSEIWQILDEYYIKRSKGLDQILEQLKNN